MFSLSSSERCLKKGKWGINEAAITFVDTPQVSSSSPLILPFPVVVVALQITDHRRSSISSIVKAPPKLGLRLRPLLETI